MANREQLEQKVSFRSAKVLLVISAIAVAGLTFIVWYATVQKVVDTSSAYVVCNHAPSEHMELTDSEKMSLSSYPGAPISTEGRVRINKECYRSYSGGKDPELATESDIAFFKAMEADSLGKVFAIEGITEGTNYHTGYLFGVLLIEYLVFLGIKRTGLYIFGGKEALT